MKRKENVLRVPSPDPEHCERYETPGCVVAHPPGGSTPCRPADDDAFKPRVVSGSLDALEELRRRAEKAEAERDAIKAWIVECRDTSTDSMAWKALDEAIRGIEVGAHDALAAAVKAGPQ